MTQNDKELLLKDLSARLPYGIFVYDEIDNKSIYTISYHPHIDNCKPYLRPISSMTSKEWVEFCDCSLKDEASWVLTENSQRLIPTQNREDYLNSKHFDYRGLIPMGLALEAPDGMYK